MFGLFSRSKTPRHLFVTEEAFAAIASLAGARGTNETGGAAVGYATVDDALVITDVCGPGPRGKCLPYRVTIDGRHASDFCARHADTSSGALQYLGDWHVHSQESAEPSPTDFTALRKLPPLNAWGYPTISLILSASLAGYTCLYRNRTYSVLECSILC